MKAQIRNYTHTERSKKKATRAKCGMKGTIDIIRETGNREKLRTKPIDYKKMVAGTIGNQSGTTEENYALILTQGTYP